MIMTSRGFRSLRVAVVLFFLVVAYYHLISPSNRNYWNAFREKTPDASEITPEEATTILDYPLQHPLSLSRRPELGYTHVAAIDQEFVPSRKPDAEDRILIIVGDTHGAYAELRALKSKIERLHPVQKQHFIFVGDMVTKGPQSLEVLDFARSLNASCVRGNQEDRLLLMYRELQNSVDQNPQIKGDDDIFGLRINQKFLPGARRRNSELAKIMTPQHAEYLESCPLVLTAKDVGSIGDLAVVHAGVLAGVPFEVCYLLALCILKSQRTDMIV